MKFPHLLGMAYKEFWLATVYLKEMGAWTFLDHIEPQLEPGIYLVQAG